MLLSLFVIMYFYRDGYCTIFYEDNNRKVLYVYFQSRTDNFLLSTVKCIFIALKNNNNTQMYSIHRTLLSRYA